MLVLWSLVLEPPDPARIRVGADERRMISDSSVDFTLSRALSSDGRRKCWCCITTALGVEGWTPARDGVEAAEEADVAGDGGPPSSMG